MLISLSPAAQFHAFFPFLCTRIAFHSARIARNALLHDFSCFSCLKSSTICHSSWESWTVREISGWGIWLVNHTGRHPSNAKPPPRGSPGWRLRYASGVPDICGISLARGPTARSGETPAYQVSMASTPPQRLVNLTSPAARQTQNRRLREPSRRSDPVRGLCGDQGPAGGVGFSAA